MADDGFFGVMRRGLYAFLSLVAGGVCAGGVMLVSSLFGGLYGLFVGIPALLIWPIGMLVVGAPVWAVLHTRGLRSRKVALIAGAAGGAVSVFVVAALIFGPSGGAFAVLLLTAAGTISGLIGGNVTWTLAYGAQDAARA